MLAYTDIKNSPSVSKSSKFFSVKISSLRFFFFNLPYKFIYRVSFFPPTLSRQKVATHLVHES